MSANSFTRAGSQDGDPVDQRAYFRWEFKGTTFSCHIGRKQFDIRLKNLSRGGACAMVDEPFAIGDYFFLELDPHAVVEAQVVWARGVMIGVRFNRILTATFVTRLHERAAEEAAEREKSALEALRAARRQ